MRSVTVTRHGIAVIVVVVVVIIIIIIIIAVHHFVAATLFCRVLCLVPSNQILCQLRCLCSGTVSMSTALPYARVLVCVPLVLLVYPPFAASTKYKP